jgi:hypothetical protein
MNVKIYNVIVYPYHGLSFPSEDNYAIEVRDKYSNVILWSYCKIGDDISQAIEEQITPEWLISQWRLINPNIIGTRKLKTLSYDTSVVNDKILEDVIEFMKTIR